MKAILKVVCEQRDVCGLAAHCGHGTPHACARCSSCGAWCDRSNALCNGGLCTQPSNRVTALGLVPYEPTFPVRCVTIPEEAHEGAARTRGV